MSHSSWHWLLRAPFALGALWLAWLAWDSQLRLDLASFLIVTIVGLLGLLALRRWSPLIVGTLLLLPLAWHFAVSLPAAQTQLSALAPDATLRLTATVRDRVDLKEAEPRAVRLLLGDVQLTSGDATRSIAEMEVEFPAASAFTFRSGRSIRIAGWVRRVERVDHRLRIALQPVDYAFDDRPAWATGEAWRIRLGDRANYYLSKRVSAVFLPLVLDVRDRRSVESRELVAEFRRVGISHIFAISGMNVALIFGMLTVAQRLLLTRVQPGQGWVHARDLGRALNVALIWLYIAMIGLPTPAVRAAIMGTALLALESRGARTPPLYVLTLTGLAMLAWDPSQFYDISFQLSFLAYAFLMLGLSVGGAEPRVEGEAWAPSLLRKGAWLLAMNLGVTGVVTLGLWPLIAARFGTFSWLVFAGNLLLVPVMGAVILPAAMVALVVSAFFVAAAPGDWVERIVFGAMEAILVPWLWALRVVDRIGEGSYFSVAADWSARQGVLYYVALVVFLALLARFRAREMRSGAARDS